jgi:methylated-DNA-protein-cysteine methyltransferase-like protein
MAPIKKILPSGKKDASFFEQVYAVVAFIPFGRVTSYCAIAKFLGTKISARMVGWALHNAHHLPHVPAHRAVNRNGQLSGKAHFYTPQQMQE